VKRLLKEPLLHFLLHGTAVFVVFAILDRPDGLKGGKIVVTAGKIEHLRASFTRVWQRPPSPDELDGLIQDYVREEVLAREAVALGLDRDDTVIRRPLRQKMEFVANDLAAQADFAAMGDSTLLSPELVDARASEVAGMFGELFARQLSQLPQGRWQGPVVSGYGMHLVFLEERTDGRLPELQEIRQAVAREWANAHRLEANERFYQELLRRYTVTIERPPTAVETKTLTEQVRQ
jgi:hypothetical protein